MRDFPSCFGESGVQIADSSSSSSSSSSKSAQNLVTCLYWAQLGSRSCVITVTWTKNLMGQGLGISIEDSTNQCLGKLDIKPSLFSKKKGSKSLDSDDMKLEVFWDLSSAKFGSGPEPPEGFYVAIVFDLQMVLLLGDLNKEAYRKTGASLPPSNAVFISRREQLFGKKVYCTKAQFCNNGRIHDVVIECDTMGLKDPCLEIRVDRKRVMQVKRLLWKFRGNQTILVDGIAVEVFWDVHSWLFDAPAGSAVFMFQTCLSADKLLPWSCSQGFGESQLRGLGFSLILYAWKNESKIIEGKHARDGYRFITYFQFCPRTSNRVQIFHRIFEKSKPVLLDSLQKVSMPGTGLDIIPEHLVPTIRAWLAIRRQVGYCCVSSKRDTNASRHHLL